jgi:hypothetical protein
LWSIDVDIVVLEQLLLSDDGSKIPDANRETKVNTAVDETQFKGTLGVWRRESRAYLRRRLACSVAAAA